MADTNQPPPLPSQQPPPLPSQQPPPLPQNKKTNQPERWNSLRGGKGARKAGVEGGVIEGKGGLGNFSDRISQKAKNLASGKNKDKQEQKDGPGGMAEKMGGPGGDGSASSTSKEIADTIVKTGMDADILVVLPFAVMFDLFGIIALILSFFGVGMALQEVLDVSATIIFGFWIIVRTLFQSVVLKTLSAVEKTVGSIGKNVGGQQQGQQAPAPAGKGLAGVGGKVAKKGFKLSMEIAWWIILSILKLIPILGDLIPSYTILVIRQFNLVKKAQGMGK